MPRALPLFLTVYHFPCTCSSLSLSLCLALVLLYTALPHVCSLLLHPRSFTVSVRPHFLPLRFRVLLLFRLSPFYPGSNCLSFPCYFFLTLFLVSGLLLIFNRFGVFLLDRLLLPFSLFPSSSSLDPTLRVSETSQFIIDTNHSTFLPSTPKFSLGFRDCPNDSVKLPRSK